MNLHYDMSIIKVLMLLLILKLGSDNNLNTVIHNNEIIKHVTIIITISVLISLLYKNMDITQIIFYSLIVYGLYVLTIKIDKKYIIYVGLLITILYFIDYYNKRIIENIKLDKNINSSEKYKLIKKYNKKNNLLLISFIIIVVGGSIIYDDKQFIQHADNYSLKNFLHL
jgi:hypothetical protein